MSFKKTIILSTLFHLCFFAAALLLSADLLGSSSKILNEKVFFVELTEDIVSSGNAKSAVETKKPKPKKPLQIKTEKNPVIVGIDSYRDVQRKAVSVDPMRKQSFLSHGVETDVAGKNNNYLNTQEERANNVLLTSYKSGGNEVVDISSGGGTTSNVSYDSFSSEGIFELIRDSIENVKTYPPLARKRGIEGTVYISFRISSQGEPQDLKILKSSGSSILDTATLDIVRKAAPFPYVDSPIEVPIVFRLN